MNDFTGYPISVGDRIVYPNRTGSSMYLNQAIVEKINFAKGLITATKITVKPNKYDGFTITPGKSVVVSTPNRVVVVPLF